MALLAIRSCSMDRQRPMSPKGRKDMDGSGLMPADAGFPNLQRQGVGALKGANHAHVVS